MENVTFSVLICTYNRHEILRKALYALIEETTEKPDEIVIVNGGDEQAVRVINAFAIRSKIEIKLVRTVNKNLAVSRNVGLPHCAGSIVAMTDDDAEVFPDWVTQMKRVHAEHPEAGAVGGKVIGVGSEESIINRLADIATFPSPSEPGYVRTLPGVNISYKRAVLELLGLQDETLFRGEDVDYNWRVKQLGYQVYYHPDIKVNHHHRPTLRQFLYQHFMYGRAYYLVRCKWPDMYCIYPHKVRRLKDILKTINFLAEAVYQPILVSSRLNTWPDRLLALPILIVNQVAWRCGIIIQYLLKSDI